MGLREISGDSLVQRLNEDPEFVLHAREWTGRIRFVEDDIPRFILHIVQGAVARADGAPTPFDAFDIQLAGTKEQWRELLVDRPKAFYQDWFPAMFHHGFRVEGNFEMAIAYYPALVRLRQLLVNVSNEAAV